MSCDGSIYTALTPGETRGFVEMLRKANYVVEHVPAGYVCFEGEALVMAARRIGDMFYVRLNAAYFDTMQPHLEKVH